MFSLVYKNSVVHKFTLKIASYCLEKHVYIEFIRRKYLKVKLPRYKTLTGNRFLVKIACTLFRRLLWFNASSVMVSFKNSARLPLLPRQSGWKKCDEALIWRTLSVIVPPFAVTLLLLLLYCSLCSGHLAPANVTGTLCSVDWLKCGLLKDLFHLQGLYSVEWVIKENVWCLVRDLKWGCGKVMHLKILSW
jgi:hypothetical protein